MYRQLFQRVHNKMKFHIVKDFIAFLWRKLNAFFKWSPCIDIFFICAVNFL